jgi:isopenicillin-N N-acyltransferase like protein
MRAGSAFLLLACSLSLANSAEPLKTFQPAKHGQGELKQIQGVPVLVVRGTPAEMGEQYGVLAVKNAPDFERFQNNFFKDAKLENKTGMMKLLARRLAAGMPKHHLEEIDAAVKSSGRERDLALFGNTVYDLSTNMGCSTVIVEKARSKTGQPIFGRNFDWLPTQGIHEHTFLAVYFPAGKQPFALVTISPIVGCISGMNAAGLSVTLNQINLPMAKDKSVFNWEGVPTMLAYRRVLEDCKTVAEAEKLLNEMKRTTTACMTICDTTGGAVFEISPKSVVVRKAVQDVCLCTNHFRTDELSTVSLCWRYKKLLPLQAGQEKLGVDDVFSRLDEVSQGKSTLQSMVFEPKQRLLHLKYAFGYATKLGAKTFDLGKLFDGQ